MDTNEFKSFAKRKFTHKQWHFPLYFGLCLTKDIDQTTESPSYCTLDFIFRFFESVEMARAADMNSILHAYLLSYQKD